MIPLLTFFVNDLGKLVNIHSLYTVSMVGKNHV